nr:MAG TPA: hypothetical protein [Caudoviricetes sp.]
MLLNVMLCLSLEVQLEDPYFNYMENDKIDYTELAVI